MVSEFTKSMTTMVSGLTQALQSQKNSDPLIIYRDRPGPSIQPIPSKPKPKTTNN
jgi:hypothetical protein